MNIKELVKILADYHAAYGDPSEKPGGCLYLTVTNYLNTILSDTLDFYDLDLPDDLSEEDVILMIEFIGVMATWEQLLWTYNRSVR